MAEKVNEVRLLKSDDHFSKRGSRGFKYLGQKEVIKDLLGDLNALHGLEAVDIRLKVADSQPVAGNYNRARVDLKVSTADWNPVVWTVEGVKAGDGKYSHTFTAEVAGHLFKTWSVSSSKPLDTSNRESFRGDLTANTSRLECEDEKVAELAVYYPFKVKEQGGWLDVESPKIKGVVRSEYRAKVHQTMMDDIKMTLGEKVMRTAKI